MDATLTDVLLVEHNTAEALLIGGWLEEAGLTVMRCPGPSEPSYTCVGTHGPCALATGARVIVLDLRLAGDIAQQGTPAWMLMLRYLELGKPVVALASPQDPVRPRPDVLVDVIARPADRDALLRAVRRSLAASEVA